VVDRSVELEGERAAGSDRDSLGVAASGGTDVAPQVVGVEVGDGGVVVGVLSDVLPGRVRDAVDRELLEDVMGRNLADGQRQGRGTEKRSLHDDGGGVLRGRRERRAKTVNLSC